MNEPEFQSMPFNGTKFFEAVQMFDDETALRYLRALWYYWQHTHCSGIRDDDVGLRSLCHCPMEKWQRTKGLIFDGEHFFVLEAGKWHQKRCKMVYERELEKYKKNLAKTEAARNAVLVTRTVAESVTDETWLKSLREDKTYQGIDVDRELGRLAAWCSVNHKEATRRRFINWLNRAEKPIAVAVATKSRTVYELKSIIEAKRESAKALYDRHASPTATGSSWTNEKARQDYSKLKAEIKELTVQLGNH